MNYNDIDNDPIAYAKLRDYIVCLDAGHSSSTPGKKMKDFKEWEFNRVIVNKLAAKLARAGVDVRVTTPRGIREDEIDVPLKERADRVNEIVAMNPHKKVIGVSVHSNADGDGVIFTNASGWSIFVARKCSKASEKLATIFYKHALKRGWKGNRATPPDKYFWRSGFYMVRCTNCPFVLTESFFYTNKEDYEFLMSAEGREEIAQMHFEAIMDYILGN